MIHARPLLAIPLALLAGCGARSALESERGDASTAFDAGRPSERDARIVETDDSGSACAMPLARCDVGAGVGCCDPGSVCVDPCGTGGLCSVPGRDTCGCGGVLDECAAEGATCLFTFCDAPGVCVTEEERRRLCEGGLAPDCFRCDRCADRCVGPPPPECAGPTRVRRYTEEWLGCEGDECLYGSETFECEEGASCVDGACVNDCELLSATVLADRITPCHPPPYAPLTVLRDFDDFVALFDCAVPFVADFSAHDVVVACHDCTCAQPVSFVAAHTCGAHAVIDYSYPEYCTECDACIPSCVVVETPILPGEVRASFTRPTCDGCCPP